MKLQKATLNIKVLHNLQSHLIVQGFNSLLNAINDGDSLTLGGSIFHHFRPIYCTVSIPYDVILVFGISRVFLYLKLYCTYTEVKVIPRKIDLKPTSERASNPLATHR